MTWMYRSIRQRVTLAVDKDTVTVYVKRGGELVTRFRDLRYEYKFPQESSEVDNWFWEWVDREELIAAYREVRPMCDAAGKRSKKSNPRALTEKKVMRICYLYDYEGWTQPELAKKYGVSRTMIGGIIQGRYWQKVTGRGNQNAKTS